MNKRYLHHIWRKLRLLSPWYILFLFIIASVVCVTALRNNNLKMIELREAVYKADEKNGDVETALRNLRAHVYTHMNTDLASGSSGIRPPIQLKGRYDRLLTAERERVAANNSKIYTDAQADCERRFPAGLSGGSRIPCIQEYIAQKGAHEKPIQDALYKFDFLSPRWSPDLAGWSMVAAALLLLLFITRLSVGFWLKHTLKTHA